jgi:hypothetical protein
MRCGQAAQSGQKRHRGVIAIPVGSMGSLPCRENRRRSKTVTNAASSTSWASWKRGFWSRCPCV